MVVTLLQHLSNAIWRRLEILPGSSNKQIWSVRLYLVVLLGCFVVQQSKQKGSKRKPVTRPAMQAKSKAAGAAAQKNVASDKTMKHVSDVFKPSHNQTFICLQLLAELYVDREYMSNLLKDQSND